MNNNLSKSVFYFGNFMAVLYVAIGLFVIFSDKILVDFPFQHKIILGSAMIIYGGFRLYRYHIYNRLSKDKKINIEDED